MGRSRGRARGKWLAALLALAAGPVVATALVPLWPRIIEAWNIARLDSKDVAVRKAAAEALGEIRSVRAVPKLVQGLAREPNLVFVVRGSIIRKSPEADAPMARALARIGQPAIPHLVEA